MNPDIPHHIKEFLSPADQKTFDQIQWDDKDWQIYYEAQSAALHKIVRRRDRKPEAQPQINTDGH